MTKNNNKNGIVRWYKRTKGFGVIKEQVGNEYKDYFVFHTNTEEQLYDGLEVIFDGHYDTVKERNFAKNVRYEKDSEVNKNILHKINKTDIYYSFKNSFVEEQSNFDLFENEVRIFHKLLYKENELEEQVANDLIEELKGTEFESSGNDILKINLNENPMFLQNSQILLKEITQINKIVHKETKNLSSSTAIITYNKNEKSVFFDINLSYLSNENSSVEMQKIFVVLGGKFKNMSLFYNNSYFKSKILVESGSLVVFGNDIIKNWTVLPEIC